MPGYAGNSEQVCIVDYHSGVGPYGYGSAVCLQTGDDLTRSKRFFGDWIIAPREPTTGDPAEFYRVEGHAADGYAQMLPDAQLTAIVLEYGTYSSQRNMRGLLQEHIARFNGAATAEQKALAFREVLTTHYPDDPDWRRAVWDRADHIVDQALAGLMS